MLLPTQTKVRGRAAHPPGPTFLAYTPDGRKLVTAGSNNVIRVYETGSDGEPINIDDSQENNLAVAATNDIFATGAEDGTVFLYSLHTNQFDKILTRCTVPIRDMAFSPDGQWLAVASDELTVKIVNVEDPMKLMHLRDCRKSPKHLAFHPSGSYIAASCTDGVVYVYSLSTTEPELMQRIDGVGRALEGDAEASSRAAWHPDGRAFGIPTATREVQVVSRSDGEKQKSFAGAHLGDITSLAWSPNGAMLATTGLDGKIILWDANTQSPIARYDYANVSNFVWHPTQNIASFTTSDGEVFICPDFVAEDYSKLLDEPLQPAPFLHDALGETSGNVRKQLVNGSKSNDETRQRRQRTPDSIADILGSELDGDEEDDFVVDDDGAGYALNVNGKRTGEHLGDYGGDLKRPVGQAVWKPRIHQPFQPGSTPWRGNRRYLALNLAGFVWTVDQETHHTVTVEFYDREYHRDYHFTDPYRYDKACLNDTGALFSCPPSDDHPAMIHYRPHETWTARADWKTQLPEGEKITAIALSESFVVVTTTANYVRVYTLFGTPMRMYRQKSAPTVTCAAWRDYILTIGNGPVGPSGTSLLYSIENVRRGETYQNEDVVALADGMDLASVFFSDAGDPCIYDSEGVLLVLQGWRTPGQARWTPLLDTRRLERLASGRKEESYWPVAVAQDKFHCIILKGGDRYPYFPRPLLSEFEFSIPLGNKAPNAAAEVDLEDPDAPPSNQGPKMEEAFVRASVQHDLLADLVGATHATHQQRSDLASRELNVDKALLQLLNAECQAGEERGMKALEIAGLLRDRSGRMLEAARKIASRYGRNVLEEKIRDLAERRLAGEDDAE